MTSESTRMLVAVRSIHELVATLSYAPGAWWSVFKDSQGEYQGRAYWSDLIGRPHARIGHPCASMVEAAEHLEWTLRHDVAQMHDFEDGSGACA